MMFVLALTGATRDLDAVAQTAVCISGALIFTTIQAQDFADVEGDAALGRKTFPIIAPRASRVASLLAMCAWSLGLAAFWDVGPLVGGAFVALGSFVGARFFFLRTAEEDERSYVLYNVSVSPSSTQTCSISASDRLTSIFAPPCLADLAHAGARHAEPRTDGAVRTMIWI